MESRPKKESPGSSQFVRGEKGTSSVRLRKRRDDVNQVGRRQNRHSGDFAFFSPTKENEENNHAMRGDKYSVHNSNYPDCDQWNYITFPNGVPNVQEVKIDSDMPTQEGVLSPTSVKVMMKEVPWISPVKAFSNVSSSGPLSGSVLNIREHYPIDKNQQKNGGHSHLHFSHADLNAVNRLDNSDSKLRFSPHARSHSQQPNVTSNHLKQARQMTSMHTNLHVTPTRNISNHDKLLRKQGNSSAKRCSGEFEYKHKNQQNEFMSLITPPSSQDLDKAEERQIIERMIKQELKGDTVSQESEESGIFSTASSNDSPQRTKEHNRKPGLGRRAITQINIRDRKNSYSSALAKSQENLVKVSSDGSAEELFDENEHSSCIKKGLLWQQRDKLFSRWKERYFILTKDLLQCFKKETSKITDMGGFIFKIKLSDVDDVELLDKRGYLTICITLQKEGKVFLRRTEGIRDWFEAIKENLQESKNRKSNRASAIFIDRRQKTDSSGMEKWMSRKSLGNIKLSESTPEINKVGVGTNKERITLDELSNLYKNEELEEERKKAEEEETRSKVSKKVNRLSVMSDIDYLSEDQNDGLGIDLESGMFPRRASRDLDSGNNSLCTNHSTSTGSSKMSSSGGNCLETSFMEEDEDDYSENIGKTSSNDERTYKPQINTNIIEVRYKERPSKDVHNNRRSVSGLNGHSPRHNKDTDHHRRRSVNVNHLQITHV